VNLPARAVCWLPPPAVRVRATNGAGDAASAALLHALASGQDLPTTANTVRGVVAAQLSENWDAAADLGLGDPEVVPRGWARQEDGTMGRSARE
jgi:sugar/nucleoside kinase (ribokinase family)